MWEYGSMEVAIFNVQKLILLNANKNLEISESKFGSVGVWECVKIIFNKTHFINSSLKPFIHACFRVYEINTSTLPYFHTPILSYLFQNIFGMKCIASYLCGRFLKE